MANQIVTSRTGGGPPPPPPQSRGPALTFVLTFMSFSSLLLSIHRQARDDTPSVSSSTVLESNVADGP